MTLYIHDIDDHIITETNTAGRTLREYIWLNDIPIAVVDNVETATPTLYYVHSDHLGRPARIMAQEVQIHAVETRRAPEIADGDQWRVNHIPDRAARTI